MGRDIKLEKGNRISMSMDLYKRIKSFAFCKTCGHVIDVCDCQELEQFAKDLSNKIKLIKNSDKDRRSKNG